MKRIRNILYGILTVSVLFVLVPLRASAAEQDSVALTQDGTAVAVTLNMSNATEEEISAVAVSLRVDAGGNGRAAVTFDFSQELSGSECGFQYTEGSDNTGRLDIYAATGTAPGLFHDGRLELGHVRVSPVASAQTLDVEVSYCDGSFQTANLSYGEKMPVVESAVEPVQIQVGVGVPDSTPGQNTTGGSQSQGNNGQNGSQGQGTADDNRNQGLYDETTRYVNNPADAQKIVSEVIKSSQTSGQLIAPTDLSKGSASGAKPAAAGSLAGTGLSGAAGAVKANGLVSVIAPKDGPASILAAAGSSSDTGESEDLTLGSQSGTGQDGSAASAGAGTEEIRLDQTNGGVMGRDRQDKIRTALTAAGILAVVMAVGAAGFFLVGRRKNDEDEKHADGKRNAADREHAGSGKHANKPKQSGGKEPVGDGKHADSRKHAGSKEHEASAGHSGKRKHGGGKEHVASTGHSGGRKHETGKKHTASTGHSGEERHSASRKQTGGVKKSKKL